LISFDVTDPRHPVSRWSLRTQSPSTHEVFDVMALGDSLYVAGDGNGFDLYRPIDSSVPPLLVTSHPDGDFAAALSIASRCGRQYAFVGYLYSNGLMAVRDLSPSDAALPTWQYHSSAKQIFGLYVDRRYAYLQSQSYSGLNALEVVDIANLDAMKSVSQFDLTDEWGSVGKMAMVDGYLYLSQGETSRGSTGGLRVFEIGASGQLSMVDHRDLPDMGLATWTGVGMGIAAHRVYLPSRHGLYIFDVSDPAHPQILVDPNVDSRFAWPSDFGACATGGEVVIRGKLAYATVVGRLDTSGNVEGKGGLAIYRVP
jgi:hypothetical protein